MTRLVWIFLSYDVTKMILDKLCGEEGMWPYTQLTSQLGAISA